MPVCQLQLYVGVRFGAAKVFPAAVKQRREALQDLQSLQQILAVRKSVLTDIVRKDIPVKRLEDVWWQRAINFWHILASASAACVLLWLSCCPALAGSVHTWAWVNPEGPFQPVW